MLYSRVDCRGAVLPRPKANKPPHFAGPPRCLFEASRVAANLICASSVGALLPNGLRSSLPTTCAAADCLDATDFGLPDRPERPDACDFGPLPDLPDATDGAFDLRSGPDLEPGAVLV